tara:strand:- start:1507 stop:1977 length:471 start_codon:yes stop_codon:yes gene_type:complete
MRFFIFFVILLTTHIFAHEDGGEKDIRCSVTYGTKEVDDYNRKIEGGPLYTMTIQPAISTTFLNNHVDIGVLSEKYCNAAGVCFAWESAVVGVAPHLEFIAETKNGIQQTGKYAILNYQDPPKIKPHPRNYKNTWVISKEQYDEAETGLNYCILIY